MGRTSKAGSSLATSRPFRSSTFGSDDTLTLRSRNWKGTGSIPCLSIALDRCREHHASGFLVNSPSFICRVLHRWWEPIDVET